MVYPQTILTIIDNSGVNQVKCIQVKKKNYKKYGQIGSFFMGVIVSLKKTKKKNIHKTGDVVYGIIVHTKKTILKNGINISYLKNTAIILDKKNIKIKTPQSTRLYGPIPFFFKQKGFSKIITLTKRFI